MVADMRSGDSGVTLIETLVVLVLIGVAAGIVTLAVPGPAPPRAIAQEAQLLSSRINLAAERSLVAAQHLRMVWRDDGYAFEVWNGEDWAGDSPPPLTGRYHMEDGIILSDGDGKRSGTVRIDPNLMPVRGAVEVFRVGSGADQQEVQFDGARARPVP